MSFQTLEKLIIVCGAFAAIVQASIMCKQLMDSGQQVVAKAPAVEQSICIRQ